MAALLTWSDGRLLRAGVPHRILAGAIHYFRVHPDQWADRLARLRAMGANTVDTYLAWNFHQPRETEPPDFTGWRDVSRFVELAAGLGLDVIMRPGPYICAEWDNGGLPAWLTGRDLIPRTADPRWTAPIEEWFDDALPRLTGLQAAASGPIVAWQAENEYGSYGDDADYLRWNVRALAERGVTELIFTADGGEDYFLDGGALPGVLAAATFGSRAAESLEVWRRRRPGEPMINIEFWDGWFDHWGERHTTRPGSDVAAEIGTTLDAGGLDGGGSVCLYMGHGGTNFGLWAGANTGPGPAGELPERIQPTATSYDYDAPIAEDGSLTEKFHAVRAVFGAYAELPPVPERLAATPRRLAPTELPARPGPGLLDWARASDPLPGIAPRPFTDLGIDQGLVLYSARPVLSAGDQVLRLRDLHDRAQVWLDGVPLGVLDELTGAEGLPFTGTGERGRVDVLVENRGRINYGPRSFEDKGILGGVLITGRYAFGWQHRPLPLPELGEPELDSIMSGAIEAGAGSPGWARAELIIDEPADCWLAFPGFGRGFVWLNGFLLGRYDAAGPQRNLYCPAPLLRAGANTVTALDLERRGASIAVEDAPRLG